MKATWQYFAEMLFIMPQKVALTFEFVNEILWNLLNCTHACSCELLIILYKVVLTFESGDETLKCDCSNDSYWTVLFFVGAASRWSIAITNTNIANIGLRLIAKNDCTGLLCEWARRQMGNVLLLTRKTTSAVFKWLTANHNLCMW